MEVAVEVEPQEISRIVARPPGLGWHRPLKPQGIEVELGHEGVQEADRVIGPDVIIEHFREEHGLRAIGTGDVGHVVELRAGGALAKTGDAQYMEGKRVFTQAPLGAGGRGQVG